MAGISEPRGGASHSRLRRVADPYPSRMGEALWQTRLRWRLRGAMLWPAFVAAVVIEAVLLDRLPVSGDDGPGLFAAVLLAGFANLVVVAVAAPLAGRWLRRRRPGMPPVIATDRAGAVLVAAGGALVVALGLLHHSSVQAARADLSAQATSARRFVVNQAPREFQANVDHLEHGQAGRPPLPHLRRRPRLPSRLLRLRQHRPVAARRHLRPRPAAQRRRGALGAVGVWSRRGVGRTASAYSITEGKEPGAVRGGGGHFGRCWVWAPDSRKSARCDEASSCDTKASTSRRKSACDGRAAPAACPR